MEIDGPWEVRFPAGWGAPASKLFPKLTSWTENSDEGIKYFSGIASYYKEFELPGSLAEDDKHIMLDLGGVKLIADVYINGNHAGICWKYPFTIDITNAVKPGKNSLVIEVANTWNNRLKGDASLPQNKRYTQTNIKHVGGPLKKGPKWADAALMESGLLGPVKLIFAERIIMSIK